MNSISLRGSIIGFEDNQDFVMEAPFGEDSPLRLLACTSAPISFVVISPYHVLEDYSFEIDDHIVDELGLQEDALENISVLCIIRPQETTLTVNLRSPLVINTKNGEFKQIVLRNESYGVSVPFAVKVGE